MFNMGKENVKHNTSEFHRLNLFLKRQYPTEANANNGFTTLREASNKVYNRKQKKLHVSKCKKKKPVKKKDRSILLTAKHRTHCNFL